MRDLTVHGDDLVIATHGRSFWILDDITPLRQAAQRAQSADAFLYKPQRTVRIDNDAFPGTPIPPEEPTADHPPNGAVFDYYLPGAAQAIALRVYDATHQLVRHVTSAPSPAKPPHAPLPIAERWFPKPQGLGTSPGMHRFVWNLGWDPSGKPEDNEPDDGEGRVPHAPRVAPGTYTVELEVDGKTVTTQPLILVKDPRSPATQAQFVQQFSTSHQIFRDSLAGRHALSEINSVKEQLDRIGSNAAAAAPVIAKAKTLRADLDSIVEGNAGLDAATTELATALNAVESSDRPAPSQALAVYRLGRSASHAQIQQWSALKNGALATFNQELQTQGLAPVTITLAIPDRLTQN